MGVVCTMLISALERQKQRQMDFCESTLWIPGQPRLQREEEEKREKEEER